MIKEKLRAITLAVFRLFTKQFFKNTYRTRVMIIHDKKILLTQDRLSDGDWKLPGGGMKKDEDVKDCGSREIKEELGIDIKAKDLVHLKTIQPTKDAPFYKEVLKATLKEQPKIVMDKFELSKAEWFPINNLPKNVDEVILTSIKLL